MVNRSDIEYWQHLVKPGVTEKYSSEYLAIEMRKMFEAFLREQQRAESTRQEVELLDRTLIRIRRATDPFV